MKVVQCVRPNFRFLWLNSIQIQALITDVDAMFATGDTDADGELSEYEAASSLSPGAAPMRDETTDEVEITVSNEEVSTVMSNLDADGDSSISEFELKSAVLEVKLSAYRILSGDSEEDDTTSRMNLLG